jgi:hypothetical protein
MDSTPIVSALDMTISTYSTSTTGYYRRQTAIGGQVVYITLTQKTDFPDDWTKYQIVYKVDIGYVEPGLGCMG